MYAIIRAGGKQAKAKGERRARADEKSKRLRLQVEAHGSPGQAA